MLIRNLSTAGLTITAASRFSWMEHPHAALDSFICVHRQDFQMHSYLASVESV